MRAFLLVSAFGLIAGCGGAAVAANYGGPVTSSDSAAGQQVFANFCSGCHPGGEAGAGPALTGHPHTAGQNRQQIREGSGSMPGFGEDRISASDLEALLAYMTTIGAVR